MRRLEQSLGVAWFVRTNRGLVLTDAGRLLAPRAERAVAGARDAEEAVRKAGAIVSGTVTFGTFLTRAPPSTGVPRFPRFWSLLGGSRLDPRVAGFIRPVGVPRPRA